jgi:hypothetical protein
VRNFAFTTRAMLGNAKFSVPTSSVTTLQDQVELGPRISKRKDGRKGGKKSCISSIVFRIPINVRALQSVFLCYKLHRTSLLVRTRAPTTTIFSCALPIAEMARGKKATTNWSSEMSNRSSFSKFICSLLSES